VFSAAATAVSHSVNRNPGARADATLLSQFAGMNVDAVIARQYAGDVPWFASGVGTWWSDNQSQKKERSLAALDAVLAEYGA
jgi:hypothetical protein